MKNIKSNIISALCIIVILACTLPMLYFFRFSVLGGDDFLYGRDTFHTLIKGGTYWDAVKVAFQGVADSYLHWQGTFASIFLMYLHPGIISLTLYRTMLALIFVLGIASPCIAAFAINKNYLKAPKHLIWIMLAAYTLVVTQYMPSIYQAYYWYNSTIYYQFTLSLAFLFVAAFAKYRNAKNKAVRGVLISCLIILSVMIAGSNFPLGLVFAAAFAIYIAAAFIKKFERRKTDAIIFAVFIAIFLINVLAPGNGARQGAYSVNPGLFGAAYASVRDMIVETPDWIRSTVTIGIICAMLPLSGKIVQNSKIKFVHPLIAGAVIVFLLLAQYYPVEYGLGSKGPARVENLRFMLLNLGLWLFFIDLFGYLKGKEKPVSIVLASVLSIIALSLSLSHTGITEFTSYKMADQITSGELSEFAEITADEIAQFEDPQKNAQVDYSAHITNEFLHPDITFWFHSGIWDYYRKAPKK